MSLYTKYQTDAAKEVAGVEITLDYDEQGQPITFIVSRTGGANKEYDKALEEATKPYRRSTQVGIKIPEEKDRQIYREVFAKTVLKGWSANVTGENGEPFPFSVENAVKLFNDLPEVFDQLRIEAGNIANFRRDALEAEAKN